MNIVLFDSFESFENLLPLSYTRPVADFRVGIMTIREKWMRFLPGRYSYLTTEYLREKFPVEVADDEPVLFVAGNVLPDAALAEAVESLPEGEMLRDADGIVAFHGSLAALRELKGKREASEKETEKNEEPAAASSVLTEVRRIRYVFDVFGMNGEEIRRDYAFLAKGESKVAPDRSVTII